MSEPLKKLATRASETSGRNSKERRPSNPKKSSNTENLGHESLNHFVNVKLSVHNINPLSPTNPISVFVIIEIEKMAPKLYMVVASPPARAVIICAKTIGLELDLVEVNIFQGEHYKPEFVKLNPQHTVPTLDDDGFIIWDSHAIMPYLVSKYSKGNPLYPEDLQKRAVVDQRLHFDSNTLFASHLIVARALFSRKITTVTEEFSKPLKEAFDILEIFLRNTKYVAGDELTIADFSIYTSISNISIYLPVDEKKYPKIASWIKVMDDLPYSYINKEGTETSRTVFSALLSAK